MDQSLESEHRPAEGGQKCASIADSAPSSGSAPDRYKLNPWSSEGKEPKEVLGCPSQTGRFTSTGAAL